MKRVALISIILLVCSALFARPQFGRSQLAVNDWKFILSPSDSFPKNTDKWEKLNLPHDWSVKQPFNPSKASAQGYLPGGVGWYYKALEISEKEVGNKVYIYFEGVYNKSKVYINGKLLGFRPNGYISFMYDLTPYIKYGKVNDLYVRVDHSDDADSRWYTGSGIYRDVFVVYANPVHVDLWGVFWQADNISTKKADMKIATTLKNESDKPAKVKVRQQVFDKANGKIVGTSEESIILQNNTKFECKQLVKIKNPRLWSIKNPNLYEIKTSVFVNGVLTEENSLNSGIRTLTFDENKGFALNGIFTKLKGVCIHHDAGVLGSAVPRDVWKRRLQNLQSVGCNAIRMSHNPQATAVYELCDELGFVVMNEAFDEWEFPKRKWLEGWNVGIPGFQGYASFFKEWGERDLRDMVMRDRNHPSIIMWSIGNEVDYPNDPYSHPILNGSGISQPSYGGYLPNQPKAERLGDISKKLATIVRNIDTTRPVTAALAGVAMSNSTDYPFNIDIAGYNYTEDRYDLDHKIYPKRVIYGSENRSDFNAWKDVRDREFIFGQFIWTGFDYLGESGPWPSRGFYTGLIDFGGFLKPRGEFRRSLWSDKPMAYLGTYPVSKDLSIDAWPNWNYKPTEMIRVVCYTNAKKARLLLNNQQVGIVKPYDDNTGIIFWDIPFNSGKLSVEGLDENDKIICNYSISTSGAPYAIRATSDVSEISKERGISQVTIQIVDSNGLPVFLSDDLITCHTDENTKLLGMESSNNEDMSNWSDNKHRVFNGRMIVYLQATGKSGKSTINFTSQWLKEAKLDILIN